MCHFAIGLTLYRQACRKRSHAGIVNVNVNDQFIYCINAKASCAEYVSKWQRGKSSKLV